MKLTYFDAPTPVVEGSTRFFVASGFWRDHLHPQRCTYLIPQEGLTANGRRRPDRWCKNDAKYATYTGEVEDIHKWLDPLCTQHFKMKGY